MFFLLCFLKRRATYGAMSEAHKLEISETLEFAAEREHVFAVLMDIADYPRFVPGLRSSELIASDATSMEVRYSAGIAFLEIPHTMRMVRSGPDELRFAQTSGMFRSVRGSWRLLDSTDATGDGPLTRMRYTICVELPAAAPSWAVRLALRVFFPGMLAGFRDAVHSSRSEPVAGSGI